MVLDPINYLTSQPSKGVRDRLVNALQTWLDIPEDSANSIKSIIAALHNSSLMYNGDRIIGDRTLSDLCRLDDIEDGSPLRRGKPATHQIYGEAQTINSATYLYAQAADKVLKLKNPDCMTIFIGMP